MSSDDLGCAPGMRCLDTNLGACCAGTKECREAKCTATMCPQSSSCERITCTTDAACDCGVCVNGRCEDGPGSCLVQPSPPP